MNTSFESKLDEEFARCVNLPVISRVLARLRAELPKDLLFHSCAHTENVIREVLRFSLDDNLSEADRTLLAVAAAFHDSGFLETREDNEANGARLAREAMLADGGFSIEEIELVRAMILDTRLVGTKKGPKQIPTHSLSRYLLDADLSNLGREDFLDRTEELIGELGAEPTEFFHHAKTLLDNHEWLTEAGHKWRSEGQEENSRLLALQLRSQGSGGVADDSQRNEETQLTPERILFLSRLPLLLNSSLEVEVITGLALEHLKRILDSEAATLFLLDPSEQELTFWSMKGDESGRLQGLRMPASKGVVGWSIANQRSVKINDVEKDPRFFAQIDREGSFLTRNLLCSPLTVRGDRRLGAVQVLNKGGGKEFSEDDLNFLDQFAHQMSIALENARLYEQLLIENEKLFQLDRRKNEMITVIAHEFRTPLSVIQSTGDMIASGFLKDAATQAKMGDTLLSGVRRLTRLVSEIQNIAYVSGDRYDLNLGEMDVPSVFQSLTEKFSEPLKKRNLSFDVELEPDLPLVRADSSLIFVVLDNLMANAIRFTDDGGKIVLSASAQSGMVRVSVKDSGIGIDASQHQLIFEKFYEVGDSMSHSSGEYEFCSGGLGLGLSTVKAILNSHGASIQIESALGQGSTFTFHLPAIER